MKKTIIVFILMSLAFAAFPADSDTVATVKLVKTEPIFVKQLRSEVELMEKLTGQKLTLDERKKLLVDKMIPERLVLQAAERDKLYADEKAVEQQLSRLRDALSQQQRRQATDAEFAEAIRKEMGMDIPAYRAELKRQYIIQQYVLKYAQEKKSGLLQSIKEPTDKEIIEYYNENKTKAVLPDTAYLNMIQIPITDNKTKAKEKGDKLVLEIGGNSTKFDQVSVRGAAGTDGYSSGGPMPIPRNAEARQVFGADFMNTIFAMKLGDVSKLIETPKAYYIVKLVDMREQHNIALDDEIQPGNAMTMREYIKAGLTQQKQAEIIKKIQDELVAELSKGNPYSINEKYINY
ncbi:MAG: peptidyl-prolyl cis-trans isomerase [Spirochaetaceae bacterium]|jgi:parvulin-like peptidyl-prolyl isomerase|nr:peptidyl-prolyl cis-trans isomerase [Spirochaetaceae bacterium]